MLSTSLRPPRQASDLSRASNCSSSKHSGVHLGCQSSFQQHQQLHSRVVCQAICLQPAPAQDLISSVAQLHRSSAPVAQARPCVVGTRVVRAGKQRVCRALSPSPTAAAGMMTADGSSNGGMPTSPPVGPQRAATQKGSGTSPAQAAVAALAAPYVTLQQQHQQHSMDAGMSQAHVWLPDQQLWLPRPAAAVAIASNPLSSRASSSGSSLARVFMASSAVRHPAMGRGLGGTCWM